MAVGLDSWFRVFVNIICLPLPLPYFVLYKKRSLFDSFCVINIKHFPFFCKLSWICCWKDESANIPNGTMCKNLFEFSRVGIKKYILRQGRYNLTHWKLHTQRAGGFTIKFSSHFSLLDVYLFCCVYGQISYTVGQ